MARQHARRQHRERLLGVTVVVLGVAVLVVAVLALRQPGGHTADAAATASSSTSSADAPTSASSRTSTGSAPHASSTAPTSTAPSSTEATSSQPPSLAKLRRKVTLTVLNNTQTSGLAQSAANSFEGGGWTVDDVSNYTGAILSTCAYYDPDGKYAKDAAKALRDQFPGIQRVQPRFDGLPSDNVVVVLTTDYSTN